MRKLSECELFIDLDKKTKISKNLATINTQTEFLDPEVLDDNLAIIRRRFNYTMKSKVLADLDMGKLVLLYPEDERFTKILPFFTFKDKNGKILAMINMKLYGSFDRNNYFDIDNRKLFYQLQSGSLAISLLEDWDKVKYNPRINKLSTTIYVKMFNKILDKLFGLNFTPVKSDQVNYLIGKFFQHYVFMKHDDSVESIALTMAFNNSRKETVQSIEDNLDVDNMYKSLGSFINELSTIDGLEKLDYRGFVYEWIKLYGENTALAMEYYPMLLDNIFAAMLSARVNKEFVFENLISKDTLDLYTELSRIYK